MFVEAVFLQVKFKCQKKNVMLFALEKKRDSKDRSMSSESPVVDISRVSTFCSNIVPFVRITLFCGQAQF